ncbi:MAG: SDR family NAD(P)-dependent oxidoreductase, partial [Crocinitomicaceae bacterium]
MKILVTGGAGFIGSNVCEALIKRGDHVHCLDNFITGKSENLNAVHDHPNFTFFEGDIRSLETCQTAIKGCEAVIHLAALG